MVDEPDDTLLTPESVIASERRRLGTALDQLASISSRDVRGVCVLPQHKGTSMTRNKPLGFLSAVVAVPLVALAAAGSRRDGGRGRRRAAAAAAAAVGLPRRRQSPPARALRPSASRTAASARSSSPRGA